MKKKLTDIEEMKNLHPRKVLVTELIRENPEVSEWLDKLFQLKDSDEISLSFRKIAEELSQFLGIVVDGRQVNDAYWLWRKSKK